MHNDTPTLRSSIPGGAGVPPVISPSAARGTGVPPIISPSSPGGTSLRPVALLAPSPSSPPTAHSPLPTARSRGFSMIEMLLATMISSMLFTSLVVSLDAMFKGYEQTTDSASTQVVTRIAVNRVLAMIRTGDEFGPLPADVLIECDNPIAADYFEFVSLRSDSGQATRITRIEFRDGEGAALGASWSAMCEAPTGGVSGDLPGSLWIINQDLDPVSGDVEETTARLLLSGVRNCVFTLSYAKGPRLARATIDITVDPNVEEAIDVSTDAAPSTTRLIASAMPRRL